jgi:selenocysteine-specific elongation factor
LHVVATAGHVDHGKSTLVLALTGTDPDRFAEEKARGLTIDLGFAHTVLPSGAPISFVDVPGHVRFIKNMLAGVGAVDACLFVVAATEGWKPQSEEHLRILELLGIRRGVIALTKVGLVDEDWAELARLDVADHVDGSFLTDADIVAVDAPSGRGTKDLLDALDRLLAGTPVSSDRGRARLWVDRCFAARGAGTVVTGTLTGGPLAVGDELELVPGQGDALRVRGLQSHNQPLPQVGPGNRVAVNLVGISHDQVWRGQALVRAAQWAPTQTFDATLEVLASLDHEVSRRGAYHAYLGSGEHSARIRVLGAATISPGHNGMIRVHLPVALPLLPGDRYVLRESGRSETVGGGEVLDVAPLLPASKARPDRSVDRVVAERGWVETELLERLTGVQRAAEVGRWVVDPGARADAEARLRQLISDAGPSGVDAARLNERERATVRLMSDIDVSDGRVRTQPSSEEGARRAGATTRPSESAQASRSERQAGPGTGSQSGPEEEPVAARASDADKHAYLVALEASPFQPPPPEGVDRVELRQLIRSGVVVERDGCYFAAIAVESAAATIASLLASSPGGVTVSQVRDALGTSRKFLLPLLAHLDSAGVTRRRGDLRIGGPRLPPPSSASAP